MPESISAPVNRPATTSPARDNDTWADVTADHVASLLSEEGLSLELVVFYDPLTETLHAVGYDGAPARYFASLPASSDSPRSQGTPMSNKDASQLAKNNPQGRLTHP